MKRNPKPETTLLCEGLPTPHAIRPKVSTAARSGDLRRTMRTMMFMLAVCCAALRCATAETTDASKPPPGFVALFNGKDLTGWKGLVDNPIKRAKMTPDQLKAAQAKADESMRAHWKAVDGELVFDGKGQSLCTAKDYKDFEMLVDWKILPKGDSGIYLRGSPQVQIWDNPLGSGGLYNNKKNPSNPLVVADKPIGQWNTFRIKMVGEKVTVYLNDKLVVDNVTLENYWDRKQPIFPAGQIELQNHGNTLWFRNIFVRELADEGGKQ
jgi:hypothetical protein